MNASDLLNGITKAKRSQAALTAYLLKEDEPLGHKVNGCGTWLHFREWLLDGETRLLNANFCKSHLLCQACAVRRAAKMHDAYQPKVDAVLEECPRLVPAMVTLTVKNGKDLGERIAHLKSSWAKMMAAKRKGASLKSRGNVRIEWNKVHGSLRAMEITRSKEGEWHPHFHCYVLLSDYIDQKWLSAQWYHFTGDSYVVDVRKIKGGTKAALVEVLKYSLKFSALTESETLHAYRILKGSRLIDPQGCLRGVPEPDLDSDDLADMRGAFRDFFAVWLRRFQKFHLREANPQELECPADPPAPPVHDEETESLIPY